MTWFCQESGIYGEDRSFNAISDEPRLIEALFRIFMDRIFHLIKFTLATFVISLSSAALAAQPAVVFVVDSSNSMWSQIDGTHKVVMVRNVLNTAFGALAGQVESGVVSYGHREQNVCKDYETIVPVGAIDRDAFMQAVSRLNPKGATPIAASITLAVQAAISAESPSRAIDVVLVFDGPDNCAGNPCQVAANLKQQHPGLRIHAVAFKKGASDSLQPLSCLATATGGTFFNASNNAELETAFTAISAVALSQPMPAPAAQVQGPMLARPEVQVQPQTPQEPVAIASNPLIGNASDPSAVANISPTSMVLPTLRNDPMTTGSLENAPPRPAAVASTPNAAPMTSPLQGVRQQIENENSAPLGLLHLSALLTADSPALDAGLVWRIFSSKPDEQGNFRVVARNEEAQPQFELKSGKYIVHVAYGRANITQEVDVGAGLKEEMVVLNAGGLRLSSSLEGGGVLDTSKVNYSIYSSEVDEFGQRKLVFSSAPENLIIRMNSGTYHVVSQYGVANAVVRADIKIKPGQLTEATVNHHAALITFKLVNQEGGEALAGTSWSILSPEGDVIIESVGAFPSYVLAAGAYSVLARNGGTSFNRDFNVTPGRDQEVEVVTQ